VFSLENKIQDISEISIVNYSIKTRELTFSKQKQLHGLVFFLAGHTYLEFPGQIIQLLVIFNFQRGFGFDKLIDT